MIEPKEHQIIIVGITSEGMVFRPSDWAERISGNLSTFKKQRIHYSPLLYPSRVTDKTCLFVDKSLAEINPHLFNHIIAFAEKNRLTILGQ